VQPLRPTAEETASLRIAEELDSIEEAVRGGSTDLRALGFWRVVESIKRDQVLVLDHADRVGRIAPGYDADLVLLDTPDWRHLAYHFAGDIVAAVVKTGKVAWTR